MVGGRSLADPAHLLILMLIVSEGREKVWINMMMIDGSEIVNPPMTERLSLLSDTCVNLAGTDSCDWWVSRDECLKNPAWMKANCKKSCNMCDPGTVQNL
jgi:hypothetical protein